MEGAISRTSLWIWTVPSVELDHRSREARLRFERLARLFILRVTATHFRLRQLLCITRPVFSTSSEYSRPAECGPGQINFGPSVPAGFFPFRSPRPEQQRTP